ncbi:MAG: RNA-binding S4 domain-containing protein [Flavobacteriales bacterium]|jgi:ribosome-associated protein|nr:RNA-binding S4 domain-containing protein [Flavobacteriales bacterium]
MNEFPLRDEFIELIKLLKVMNFVESGGMAKAVVDEGLVTVNGEVESRKRRKLIAGDVVQFDTQSVTVLPPLPKP